MWRWRVYCEGRGGGLGSGEDGEGMTREECTEPHRDQTVLGRF